MVVNGQIEARLHLEVRLVSRGKDECRPVDDCNFLGLPSEDDIERQVNLQMFLVGLSCSIGGLRKVEYYGVLSTFVNYQPLVYFWRRGASACITEA